MIVKIQRSQPPSPAGRVLVYNKDMKFRWEGKIDSRVDQWIGDNQKIFAHAHVEGSEFVIDRLAQWQEW